MKAITLWQPYAQLMVTRQPARKPPERQEGGGKWCGYCNATLTFNFIDRPNRDGCSCERARADRNPPMVKSIETGSWSAPAGLIGQRVAIHAAARTSQIPHGRMMLPGVTTYRHPARMWMRGSDAIPLPLGAVVGSGVLTACVPMVEPMRGEEHAQLVLRSDIGKAFLHQAGDHPAHADDVSDQLPFGVFKPGRWAWIFTDAAPTTERCPACWGEGTVEVAGYDDETHCDTCGGVGRCEPIPARGMQRVWNWTP